MNKWFNKQKPLTLAFITGITAFLLCLSMSYFLIDNNFGKLEVLTFSTVISLLGFFISWLMLNMIESSIKVFDEISELYFRAKKIKTKADIIIIESDYRTLRKKAQHQGHYYKLNEIYQIIDTKKEYIKL